ncbi:MaoC/PaaZ C-terminal domain-containing protein [Amycolatopsis sp. 3B14]|uniref:MaoC/PaaZ C-terminal domain-containing protein n=1 Tax=Amycolatopsis sp. 3B14 TaxID=3243600 RepID=UPI003D958E04
MTLAQFTGTDLGTRVAEYGERDAILYALAVGAREHDLDLVFERDLKVLPTFGLTQGLWVADAAGELGVFRPESALHGAQSLVVHCALPPSGRFPISGRIGGIWDKGRSAVVDVIAECEYFTATYSIFLPGQGGWGGDPGPRQAGGDLGEPAWRAAVPILPQQAALYRLTGDRHLIHIDPAAARAAALPGPILHGLCTLGLVAREVSAAVKREPWHLTSIEARFSAPVLPGGTLEVEAEPVPEDNAVRFQALTDGATVLKAGRATFRAG